MKEFIFKRSNTSGVYKITITILAYTEADARSIINRSIIDHHAYILTN